MFNRLEGCVYNVDWNGCCGFCVDEGIWVFWLCCIVNHLCLVYEVWVKAVSVVCLA